MDGNVQKTLAYEIYKELLTKTMQEIFELYYYSNLSLREIADIKKISYQAVNDALKKAEKQLEEYELKLKACQMKSYVAKLNNELNNINIDLNVVKEIANKLGEI